MSNYFISMYGNCFHPHPSLYFAFYVFLKQISKARARQKHKRWRHLNLLKYVNYVYHLHHNFARKKEERNHFPKFIPVKQKHHAFLRGLD